MNPNRTTTLRTLGAALILPLAALLLAACDIDSVDSTTAVLSDNDGNFYSYSGLYMHPDNDSSTNGIFPLVYPYEGSSRPSGTLITSLRLLQYGSVLEAYDSANQVWSGKISSQNGKTASFTLSGQTTAGSSVEIIGTMTSSGSTDSSSDSTMDASWIEASYYGTLSAQATVAPITTNSPSPTNDFDDVEISPESVTLTTNNTPQIFYASGGDGEYTWTHNSNCGQLSSSSGSSITYTRLSTGDDTLTVTSDGESASADITCE